MTTLIDALLQLAATLILALGTVAIGRLIRWLGIQGDAAARAAFDEVLQKSVAYGLQQSQTRIKAMGWDDPSVKEQVLSDALPYVGRFPDVLKALKIDRLQGEQREVAIRQALDRAYPQAVDAAASSPATPPPTAPMPERQADLPALAHALDAH